MAENKTGPTGADVDAFLTRVADQERRGDAGNLRVVLERLSGRPAVMWGKDIVGFGAYRYKYDSGHEGEWARVSFSPRAKELVLYVTAGFARYPEIMARLGKHRTGKSCLYIKRLADIDMKALEELVSESLPFMRERDPDGA